MCFDVDWAPVEAVADREVAVRGLVALVESAASEVRTAVEGVVDSIGLVTEVKAAFLARYFLKDKAANFLEGASVEASTNPNALASVEAATVEAAGLEEAVGVLTVGASFLDPLWGVAAEIAAYCKVEVAE